MTDLSLFNSSEFGGMRVHCNPESGEVWFCLVDICKALEITNPRMVKSRLDDDVSLTYAILDSLGREQNATFVNESGLYEVLLRSDSPKAKPFRKWVTSEVLPSIRKHGMYATAELLDNPDFAIEVFKQLKAEREENKKLQDQIKKDKPKLDYANAILESGGSILIKELALWMQKNGVNIGQLKLYEWMRDNDSTHTQRFVNSSVVLTPYICTALSKNSYNANIGILPDLSK